jgi:hypothetical protein
MRRGNACSTAPWLLIPFTIDPGLPSVIYLRLHPHSAVVRDYSCTACFSPSPDLLTSLRSTWKATTLSNIYSIPASSLHRRTTVFRRQSGRRQSKHSPQGVETLPCLLPWLPTSCMTGHWFLRSCKGRSDRLCDDLDPAAQFLETVSSFLATCLTRDHRPLGQTLNSEARLLSRAMSSTSLLRICEALQIPALLHIPRTTCATKTTLELCHTLRPV